MSSNYPLRNRNANAWPLLGGMFILTLLVGVLLWGLGVIHFGREAPAPHNPAVKDREPAPRTKRNPDEVERNKVYKDALPSVVNVDTLAYTVSRFDLTAEQQRQGTGTGFFWDDGGRIVTNFHVVRDALALTSSNEVVIAENRKIVATLSNGDSFDVRLVGIAPDFDLAVVQLKRLPSAGVTPITIGTSSDLEVGQTVYAIGSPYGQQSTLTNGIISALHREIQSPTNHIIADVIQTNAALNPGNSGGPLLDKDGRLIGVNTAITSPSGGNVGIGYAIPVDTVNRVVTEIIDTGRAAQPYIGADFVLQERQVRRLGYSKGVMVRRVEAGSPAAAAGLKPGDVIVKINGEEIAGISALEHFLSRVKPGDNLTLSILRNRQELDVELKVEGI